MYQKTIAPVFEIKGKRKKLTGYLGELCDETTCVHFKEYSTYSQAEQALDALAFELLTDLAERGLVDELPNFEPTTCVFCHKPHHPQSCAEKNALLFAPELCTCGAAIAWEVPFETEPLHEYFCGVCYSRTGYFGNPISAPQAPAWDINNSEYCPAHDVWFGRVPCPKCYEERRHPQLSTPLDLDFVPVGPEV